MIFATQTRIGIKKQRGFWLRYFLERETFCTTKRKTTWKFFGLSLALLILALVPETCLGQCVYPTIYVSRIQGTLFDFSGQLIPNGEVSLVQDGKVIASVTTDDVGGFSIPASAGKYELRASARGFATGSARIKLGSSLVRVLKPTHIWMFLDVGSAQLDSCDGFVTTSHRQFEKAIQKRQKIRN